VKGSLSKNMFYPNCRI